MAPLNRDERQTLRSIQAHLHESILRQQAVTEQLGTVDVYFHPRNPAPDLNCVTPRRGVAWVRYEDLSDAFIGLRRLGRTPRFIFVDTLFPEAFTQQLGLMGLIVEREEPLLVYRPMLGPVPEGEIPLGRLPDTVQGPVRAALADSPDELAEWWAVFRQIYAPDERGEPQPKEIESLVSASRSGHTTFITAWYEDEPLGVARVTYHAGAAKMDLVLTVPLWHSMGLENALITAAANDALEQGYMTVFACAPSVELTRLYHRMGFVQMAQKLTYIVEPEADDAADSADSGSSDS